MVIADKDALEARKTFSFNNNKESRRGLINTQWKEKIES